jgi:hypothetical protein
MNPLLSRYLLNTRSNLKILDVTHAFKQWVPAIIATCFPKLHLQPVTLRIRSADLRAEFIATGGEQYLVFDQELAETLAELDYLVAKELPHIFIYVRAHLLLADCFRKHGNKRLAMFCLTKAREQAAILPQLRNATVVGPGYSISGLFVVLHELSHLALKDGKTYRNDWYEFIIRAVDSFIGQLKTIVTGEDLGRLETLTGGSFSDVDPAPLFRQLSHVTDVFERNQNLYQEVVCDIFAALTFINLKVPVSFLESTTHVTIPLNLRELGDTFYKSVVTLSNMQYLSAIRQIATNITKELTGDLLGDELSELTVRQNILIYALNLAYRHILLNVSLQPMNDDRIDRLSIEQKQQLFISSVRNYTKKRDLCLLQPLGDITAFFYSGTSFENEFLTTLGIAYHDYPGDLDFEKYDALRMEFYT